MKFNSLFITVLFTIFRKTADAIPDNIDKACGVGEKEVRVKKIIYKSKYKLVRNSCYCIIDYGATLFS